MGAAKTIKRAKHWKRQPAVPALCPPNASIVAATINTASVTFSRDGARTNHKPATNNGIQPR